MFFVKSYHQLLVDTMQGLEDLRCEYSTPHVVRPQARDHHPHGSGCVAHCTLAPSYAAR